MKPAAYPVATQAVELIQTHVSWIFLTDRHAFKLKKPVNFGFLDFSTLEKRRFYCHEELRLNRRLSPDIYEGVLELRQTVSGAALHGDGTIIDYAVMMKRLPADRMLDRLVVQGDVTVSDMHTIAETISRFHAAAETSPYISEFGSIEQIAFNTEENFQQLLPFETLTLPQQERDVLRASAQNFISTHRDLFVRRIEQGCIRECDGDLHLENICLVDGTAVIFDCIEFNERFRYCDTASDIAFLLMDLDLHGRPDLADAFLRSYLNASGDTEIVSLLPFYKLYRAVVRGKVESLQLNDTGISPEAQQSARRMACRYFRLARGYCERSTLRTTLFLTCGTSGCGKSALAEQLGFELGLRVFNSDTVRKHLAGLAPETPVLAPYRKGLYDTEMSRATYQELLKRAECELVAGRSVIIDAGFRSATERAAFGQRAVAHSAQLVILLVTCDAAEQLRRLTVRSADGHSISDGRADLLEQQQRDFEYPDAAEGCVFPIMSDATPDQLCNRIYQELQQC
jgi:aminoglycoside phosphotransferase family enzyme/predicted kinase